MSNRELKLVFFMNLRDMIINDAGSVRTWLDIGAVDGMAEPSNQLDPASNAKGTLGVESFNVAQTTGSTVDLATLKFTVDPSKYHSTDGSGCIVKASANNINSFQLNGSTGVTFVADETIGDNVILVHNDDPGTNPAGKHVRYGEVNIQFNVTNQADTTTYRARLYSLPYPLLHMLNGKQYINHETCALPNTASESYVFKNYNHPTDVRTWTSVPEAHVRGQCDRHSRAQVTSVDSSSTEPAINVGVVGSFVTYALDSANLRVSSRYINGRNFPTLGSINLGHRLVAAGRFGGTSHVVRGFEQCVVKKLHEVCGRNLYLKDCQVLRTVEVNGGTLDLLDSQYDDAYYVCVRNVGQGTASIIFGMTIDEFIGKYDLYIDYNNELCPPELDPHPPTSNPDWGYDKCPPSKSTLNLAPGHCITFIKLMNVPVKVWNYNNPTPVSS